MSCFFEMIHFGYIHKIHFIIYYFYQTNRLLNDFGLLIKLKEIIIFLKLF